MEVLPRYFPFRFQLPSPAFLSFILPSTFWQLSCSLPPPLHSCQHLQTLLSFTLPPGAAASCSSDTLSPAGLGSPASSGTAPTNASNVSSPTAEASQSVPPVLPGCILSRHPLPGTAAISLIRSYFFSLAALRVPEWSFAHKMGIPGQRSGF